MHRRVSQIQYTLSLKNIPTSRIRMKHFFQNCKKLLRKDGLNLQDWVVTFFTFNNTFSFPIERK